VDGAAGGSMIGRATTRVIEGASPSSSSSSLSEGTNKLRARTHSLDPSASGLRPGGRGPVPPSPPSVPVPPFAVAIIRRRRLARFERLKKRVQSFGGGARAASAAGSSGSGAATASGREGGRDRGGREASLSERAAHARCAFSSVGLLITVRPREAALL